LSKKNDKKIKHLFKALYVSCRSFLGSKKILKKLISHIVNNQYYYIAALILRIFITERLASGKNRAIYSKSVNCITILALDCDRYRGDLELLASVPGFRILTIRQRWQVLFLGRIYSDIYNLSLDDYFCAVPGNMIYGEVLLAKKFMQEVLARLFKIINVDCITTVNYRYIEDLDWTITAEKLGIPYIILYRECLLQKGTRFYDEITDRHAKYNFHGSHIIVHNDTCKDTFINSAYCKEENISVIGALRMDKYLRTLNERNEKNSRTKRKRKKFVLFYFPYNMSLFGKDSEMPKDYKYKYVFSVWPERKILFRDIHVVIAELAVEYPEIDFVIKPKDIMMRGDSWLFYNEVLKGIGFNQDKVNNYSIEPYADVHELILSSNVICGLQSSTVIESAISGLPVILPVFKNYRESENYKDFAWSKYLDLFNVPNNKTHLKEMIIELMDSPFVGDDVLNKRRILFKKFFNDVNGESLNKYAKVITEVAGDRKKYNTPTN